MSRFRPPPKSPNCVSSRADKADAVHHVAPIQGAELAEAKAWLLGQPRVALVEEAEGYARFECTTALFRFKDDLELEAENGVLHVRSASRLGYSDLGANRRRVEALRAALQG